MVFVVAIGGKVSAKYSIDKIDEVKTSIAETDFIKENSSLNRVKIKPFETLLGATTFIFGGLYFYGWVYRYLYFSKFGIGTVVLEMPIESFLFCGFNLTLAPLFENKGLINLIGEVFSLLCFFVIPIIVGLCLIWAFDNLQTSLEKREVKIFSDKLQDFLEDGFIFFMRDVTITGLLVLFLYFIAFRSVQQGFTIDTSENSSLPVITFLLPPTESRNVIYKNLDGVNSAYNVGNVRSKIKCTPADPCRLLLRHNNNLYLIKTTTKGQRDFKGTIIMPSNDDNKDLAFVIETKRK